MTAVTAGHSQGPFPGAQPFQDSHAGLWASGSNLTLTGLHGRSEWPCCPDWPWQSRANTEVTYKPQALFLASVHSRPCQRGGGCCVPSPSAETPKTENLGAMWGAEALLLLLGSCLAISVNPVLTLPDDIQVQENFDESRVSWPLAGLQCPVPGPGWARPACLTSRSLSGALQLSPSGRDSGAL